MKSIVSFLVLLMTVVLTPSCATGAAWWEHFKSDPVAQVGALEHSVSVAVSDATIAFNGVKGFLPADVQTKAQADFDAALISVNHAEKLLDDAVTVAVEEHAANPDLAKLIAAVVDAASQVIAVVDQYKTAIPAPNAALAAARPLEHPALTDAKAIVASLSHYKK